MTLIIALVYLIGASVAYALLMDVFDDRLGGDIIPLFLGVLMWPVSLAIATPIIIGTGLNRFVKSKVENRSIRRGSS